MFLYISRFIIAVYIVVASPKITAAPLLKYTPDTEVVSMPDRGGRLGIRYEETWHFGDTTAPGGTKLSQIVILELQKDSALRPIQARVGDMISSVNGRAFQSARGMISYITSFPPGSTVSIKLVRLNPRVDRQVEITLISHSDYLGPSKDKTSPAGQGATESTTKRNGSAQISKIEPTLSQVASCFADEYYAWSIDRRSAEEKNSPPIVGKDFVVPGDVVGFMIPYQKKNTIDRYRRYAEIKFGMSTSQADAVYGPALKYRAARGIGSQDTCSPDVKRAVRCLPSNEPDDEERLAEECY
jgi:PDZ domain